MITFTGQGIAGANMFAYCRNRPSDRIDSTGLMDEDANEEKNANIENMMKFFGVSSPDDLPELEDGCMVFIENIHSFTILGITIVVGKTIVMDNDKYCEYSFGGVSAGISVLPFDICTTAGYVYGVENPSDYAGAFFGISANVVATGAGGAIAPNGVRAEILGSYGYLSAAVGVSGTYYKAASDKWIYEQADISWHQNYYNYLWEDHSEGTMRK